MWGWREERVRLALGWMAKPRKNEGVGGPTARHCSSPPAQLVGRRQEDEGWDLPTSPTGRSWDQRSSKCNLSGEQRCPLPGTSFGV